MDEYIARLDALMANTLDESVINLVQASNNYKVTVDDVGDYSREAAEFSHYDIEEEEEDDDDNFNQDGEEDFDTQDDDSDIKNIFAYQTTGTSNNIKKSTSTKNQVPVILFDSSSNSSQFNKGSKSDWKQFMASDISKLHGDSNGNKLSKKGKKLTKEEEELEVQDKRNDKELMNLLQSSNILEEYSKSEFGAKNRHYLHDTYEMKKIKAPKNIQYGMLKKAKQRMDKRIQEAKDLGLYNAKTKNLFKDERTKFNEKKKKKESMFSRGLHGSIGKYKNGVLHVSNKDIEAVENRDKGRKKGAIGKKAFNALGGDHRKRSLPGSKSVKKKKKRT